MGARGKGGVQLFKQRCKDEGGMGKATWAIRLRGREQKRGRERWGGRVEGLGCRNRGAERGLGGWAGVGCGGEGGLGERWGPRFMNSQGDS